MVIDTSNWFPHDHFQIGLVHSPDEHRLVLRCSDHFLDPHFARNAARQHGRHAQDALEKLQNRLKPDIQKSTRTRRRFIQLLNTWALLPHNEAGERLNDKEEALRIQLGQMMEKRSPALPRLFSEYAEAYREHHVASLRHGALVRLGGKPDATQQDVKTGFVRHFNRLLDPQGRRQGIVQKLGKPLRRRIRTAQTPSELVGHYPPREPLSDLDAHLDYFASDFDRTRRFGLPTGAALESVATHPTDAFLLRMPVSEPRTAKPLLFDQLQDAFARSLQRLGFAVRVMPPE